MWGTDSGFANGWGTGSGFAVASAPAGPSFDTDSTAFFTATGITDDTIKNAVDALVVGLKADSLWTKCTAIYPFVGGSAATHLVNLKTPGTYNITWNGTVTHNANGVTGNGSTGYGNTGINPQSVMSANNAHFGAYSRTDFSETKYELGAGGAVANQRVSLACRFANLYIAQIGTDAAQMTPASADGRGFLLVTRRSTTEQELYRNGVSVITDTDSNAAGNMPNMNLYVLCTNEAGVAGSFSTKNVAYITIGTGLTDAEAALYHTRVETFQDALSRGVA